MTGKAFGVLQLICRNLQAEMFINVKIKLLAYNDEKHKKANESHTGDG